MQSCLTTCPRIGVSLALTQTNSLSTLHDMNKKSAARALVWQKQKGVARAQYERITARAPTSSS
eukprot:CAMPEP_0206593998 /NCGR_PEP_ID=MMETSP0325_2-20121206/42072_1 /ASSEMBLY_ACC=CAM_ASM_000347 /TAXON_ID=2866 /ORGANISM="Crypthecodinium cohnii, Strain Seligo" /LENGTH=63 /DNA_ID=CAMNT_0054104295 /DNA_START=97 /DNA_END=285 /DNA_ORIENTATION=+